MAARLYVVSTPIGNLEDITLRAISTLKNVSVVAAEDTRRTAILLRHFGITTPMTSYHEHNEREKLPHLLQKLAGGSAVALVSDAGTPIVADPGQRLIAAAIEHGVQVIAVPGASAAIAALTVSGMSGDAFVFAGFAPSRSNDRKRWLERFSHEPFPVIFFEAPHRIRKTLTEIRLTYGKRPITVARELTKLHEQVIHTTTERMEPESIPERGEFTIVIGPLEAKPAKAETIDENEVANYFYQLTNKSRLGRRPALTETAHKFGLSTKLVYALLERLKGSGAS
jgi:16S rRNA (cytidine1402-2'-O)-methyltransferase